MDGGHGAGVSGAGGVGLRFLAIGAYPDDLEIFAFGTLSAWAAMGAALTLLWLAFLVVLIDAVPWVAHLTF
ncbi:hypothetical protein [Tabrizicola sp.]|uniref:hypothetical protein n=1 Tax=Tabrizicola sp. TaxID=2005166 RepID=UPI003F2B6611